MADARPDPTARPPAAGAPVDTPGGATASRSAETSAPSADTTADTTAAPFAVTHADAHADSPTATHAVTPTRAPTAASTATPAAAPAAATGGPVEADLARAAAGLAPAAPRHAAAEAPRDLTRTTFAVLAIGLLALASLWVLKPFLGSMIWAAMLVIATWPLFLRVLRVLRGRRALAVTAMTLLLVLLFAAPIIIATTTIVQNDERIVAWAKAVAQFRPTRTPPPWLLTVPLVGAKLGELWTQAMALGMDGAIERVTPYAGNLTKWFVAELSDIGALLLQFFLTIVIAAVFYANGESAARHAHRFAQRLAGDRGAQTVQLAGDAIRGVALGVGGTALVQAVIGGIALAVVDIPFAGLLSALMFMLCILQVGPLPVLLPAVIWVFWSGQIGWGIFLAIVSLAVVTLDNVLRPLLIRMGADLPLLLIFAGVIGGLLAFGLVGIFVGPVVLAVAYMLLDAWMDEAPPRH